MGRRLAGRGRQHWVPAPGRQDHQGPVGTGAPGPRQAAHLEEEGGSRSVGGAPLRTRDAPSSQPPMASGSNPLPWCQQPGFGHSCLLMALLGSSLLEGDPQDLGRGDTRPLPSSQTTQRHSVPPHTTSFLFLCLSFVLCTQRRAESPVTRRTSHFLHWEMFPFPYLLGQPQADL